MVLSLRDHSLNHGNRKYYTLVFLTELPSIRGETKTWSKSLQVEIPCDQEPNETFYVDG